MHKYRMRPHVRRNDAVDYQRIETCVWIMTTSVLIPGQERSPSKAKFGRYMRSRDRCQQRLAPIWQGDADYLARNGTGPDRREILRSRYNVKMPVETTIELPIMVMVSGHSPKTRNPITNAVNKLV